MFFLAIFFIGGAIAIVGLAADVLKISRQGQNLIHFGQFVMIGAVILYVLATVVLTLDNARIVTP